MEIIEINHGSEKYLQMVALRTEVLRKPLGLVYSPQQLADEHAFVLIGAFENSQIIGCCILAPLANSQFQLKQMAVATVAQKMGIGAQIIRFAEGFAKSKNQKSIIMHARKSAVGFYEKLGYVIEGEEFLEVSIPHFLMSKQLT
jgi:predicted GNAT family N-acyltransferase